MFGSKQNKKFGSNSCFFSRWTQLLSLNVTKTYRLTGLKMWPWHLHKIWSSLSQQYLPTALTWLIWSSPAFYGFSASSDEDTDKFGEFANLLSWWFSDILFSIQFKCNFYRIFRMQAILFTLVYQMFLKKNMCSIARIYAYYFHK